MSGSQDSERDRRAPRSGAERTLAEDLAALRSLSSRDLPSLENLRRRPALAPAADPGGILMNTLRRLKAHPWLATGLATAVAAVVLLFIPISYQRVTGSNVTLSLAGESLAPAELQRIAGELRSILHAGPIRIEAGNNGVTLATQVDDRAWRQVGRLAVAYVKGLADRGIQGDARVTPRLETVQGTVYAAALNDIIEIRIQGEGKSDAEIAEEIQSQMAAAGVSDAEVEVHTDGNQRQIGVTIRKERGPDDPPQPDEACCPEFRISIDGHEPDPNDPNERRVEVRVQRTEGMTDEEVLAEVRRQLQEQGADCDVTMENGKIKVTPRE